MAEVKRSEMQRTDAEHEVTRLRAELDRQLAERREMQVLCHAVVYVKVVTSEALKAKIHYTSFSVASPLQVVKV